MTAPRVRRAGRLSPD